MVSKEEILKNITRFPSGINHVLLKANFAPGLWYGGKYLKRKKELAKNPGETSDERVLEVVNYAIKHTPYYRNLYHTPVSDLTEFIEKTGFITRDTLLEHYDDLISTDIDRKLYTEVLTGGTSGKPARFLIPKNRQIVELSTMHTIWGRTGWNYHPRAVLRNHKLNDNEIFRINPITKEFLFDNFRLNPRYVRQIYDTLIKYKIQYVQAYPSAAYQFCLLCKEQGLDLGFIRAFLCGSEGIIDFQKKLIVDELGLRLFSWFGHSEKLVIGGYCEHTDHNHIEPQYGYFELIGEDNKPIHTPGKIGEITGTTYYNYGMPLIRYRTGDYAEYVSDHCEVCGRKMPIIKNIQGRWDKNQIYRMDGTYITTTALNLHSDLYNMIEGLQYIQDEPGKLKILLIKGDSFKTDHEKSFFKHYSEAMGPDSEVVIEYVDKLITQPNGKFIQLISNLNKRK
jgi:phenylacetate-CoA ligase